MVKKVCLYGYLRYTPTAILPNFAPLIKEKQQAKTYFGYPVFYAFICSNEQITF